MKLYSDGFSPNAIRVERFLNVKGRAIEVVPVNVPAGESRTPEFLAINPLGQIPVLVLDDGTVLSESVAICRYLESVFPTPPLFGTGAVGAAVVEMWQRRMEFRLFTPAVEVGHHGAPELAHAFDQIPAFAELNRRVVAETYVWLDRELKMRPYVAGDAVSIADITALCGVDVARFWKVPLPNSCAQAEAWADRVRTHLCR